MITSFPLFKGRGEKREVTTPAQFTRRFQVWSLRHPCSQVKLCGAEGGDRAAGGRLLPATWPCSLPMGNLDVTPASSPWQRAGDYFRCCEGSGLTRVSVPLSHAVRAAAAAERCLCPGAVSSIGRALWGRERAARRMPLVGGGAGGRDLRRPSSPDLGRAWGPRWPLTSGFSLAASFPPRGRDCLYGGGGSPCSPSPTVQSRAADFSEFEAC